jgi:hypothetical protein
VGIRTVSSDWFLAVLLVMVVVRSTCLRHFRERQLAGTRWVGSANQCSEGGWPLPTRQPWRLPHSGLDDLDQCHQLPRNHHLGTPVRRDDHADAMQALGAMSAPNVDAQNVIRLWDHCAFHNRDDIGGCNPF